MIAGDRPRTDSAGSRRWAAWTGPEGRCERAVIGGEAIELPLDLQPVGIFADRQDDGTVDLLVSLYRDDQGTADDESDDRGPFIDRYRVDP